MHLRAGGAPFKVFVTLPEHSQGYSGEPKMSDLANVTNAIAPITREILVYHRERARWARAMARAATDRIAMLRWLESACYHEAIVREASAEITYV